MEQSTLYTTPEDCRRLGIRLPIVVTTGGFSWTVYGVDCDEAFARYLLLKRAKTLGWIVRFSCVHWQEKTLVASTEVMLRRVQDPGFELHEGPAAVTR